MGAIKGKKNQVQRVQVQSKEVMLTEHLVSIQLKVGQEQSTFELRDTSKFADRPESGLH